jgi:hypothetical protein
MSDLGYIARITSLERQVEQLTTENKRLFADNIRLATKLRASTTSATDASSSSTTSSSRSSSGGSGLLMSPPRRQSLPASSPAVQQHQSVRPSLSIDDQSAAPADKDSPSAPYAIVFSLMLSLIPVSLSNRHTKKTCSIVGCSNAILVPIHVLFLSQQW